MSNYRHPREIEDFDSLNTKAEKTVHKAKSEINLLSDGDGPRNWRFERRWGSGARVLIFTVLHRESPSAMATQIDFELVFIPSDDDRGGGWHFRSDRTETPLSREVVNRLVPNEFAGWLREQERSDLPFWRRAA